jgi:5-methylcytosine-specific restriction protein A
MKKFTSRNKFRESLNASCKNLQWSWSWVNHKDKNVYFGASDVHEDGDTQLILGFDWERNRKGRINSGYAEAVGNIELVLSKSYRLYTFRQFQKEIDEETGRVRITGFEQDLEQRYLIKKSDGWHALAIGDFDEWDNSSSSEGKIVYLEGSKVPVSGSRIERNSRARAACLDLHGTNCCICSFNFEKTYGDLGSEFIHVHHLKSISTSDGPHIVCPKTDLRPVCPNCHAMIHRNGKNRSIEEIRSLLLS